ncbi:MAG: PEGA domain-containing protein [Meiothermus sp.]|mgnify:CR=1 FL=1
MRKALALLLTCVTALAAAQVRPQSIIVNPTPPADLQVRVWVDKDPSGTGNPVYDFGEPIFVSVQVTQDAYVYLFSVRATGEIVGILPNAYDQDNFLRAGEVRTYPPARAQYGFTVAPPAGQDRVLAVASRRPLDVSEIVDIQTGQARIQGVQNLARALSIVVTPVPRADWVSDEAYFIAGRLPPPPTATLSVDSNPRGATVRLNGQVVGNTPLTVTINADPATLEVSRAGYPTYRTSINPRPGEQVRVFADLQALLPGRIVVDANVWGAQVYIDGRLVGNVPVNVTAAPGSRVVEVRAGGYTTFRTTVNLRPGQTERVYATLRAVAPPPQPSPPIVVPAPNVPTGRITYTCQGGRLVVNYVNPNLVQVFYDNDFQDLRLTQGGGTLVYSNGTYTWQLQGGIGAFFVRGGQVRSDCRPQ